MRFGSTPAIAVSVFVLSISLAVAQSPPSSPPTREKRQRYVTDNEKCDGYPKLPIEMTPGMCAGLVLGPPRNFGQRLIKTPRKLLQIAEDRWLITDLGNWTESEGALWEMRWVGNRPQLTRLIEGLSLPHTLARGPDRRIYLGEMSRIVRLEYDEGGSSKKVELTTVIHGLPDNRLHDNRHPLSHFIFDANGDLLVNVGAGTDQCIDPGKKVADQDRCKESSGLDAKAVIRRYRYLGDGQWSDAFQIVASGLRNSLALVQHKSGTILQGENSYDYAPNRDEPFDELNVIRHGAHYGWPYCADMTRVTPAWKAARPLDCASDAHAKPAVLLPPHAAPLDAVYYSGPMFPALRGELLISFHGYRPGGSRLVAFAVDDRGIPMIRANATYVEYAAESTKTKAFGAPSAEPQILTPGWGRRNGVRPAGAPVGITIASDGAIWLADDRNAVVLRISVDRHE